MSEKRRVLTGITTTGTPHLGNYVGAIRPAIAASHGANVESFYFLADYHALVKCSDPQRIHLSTLQIAATWLACGLDPERVFFYRQSDIPEIPELTWLLTCVTGKGLLNRAHAYKASTDANREAGEDVDAGITAGLYMYPVLMAADILMFKAHQVPVGRDQIQHIEIARDIAQRFNHIYGSEFFTLPVAAVDANTAVLPGLDGRKMAKSYDNTIPLWLPAKELRKAILGIVTNSLAPGDPKDPADSHLFTIYQAFASAEETQELRRAYLEGIAWGDAKERLFERIERELAPARERYQELIEAPEKIETTLKRGAQRARRRSRKLLKKLRAAVGLRSIVDVPTFRTVPLGASATWGASVQPPSLSALKPPRLVSYRERDGKFYFKLNADDGALLLQSAGFESPKASGQIVARLKQGDPTALALDGTTLKFSDGVAVGKLADGVSLERVHRALGALESVNAAE